MSTATMTRPAPRPTARQVALPAGLRLEPVRALSRPVGPVRLTRRGRLVITLLCALVLLAVISVGRAGSQATTATEIGPTLQQTTVQSGETLWAVAQRIAPDNDPRQVIAQIRRINNLETSSIRVGQQLLLPVAFR